MRICELKKEIDLIEYDFEEFRRKFPNLANEIEWQSQRIPIDSVRTDGKEAEKKTYLEQGFEPSAVDFIRRCDTEQQALEIINFLEERKEIEHEYAMRLRRQLIVMGLRSFGSKKRPGYYLQKVHVL
ncbi:MAG: hypothetical protein APU95_00430 [Hadesarchaea archaeon YNP_N21]|nr:MAG: hypothetical protein APU95_00430 [Hadesarchaea archaeon YNP_N21]